VLSLPLPFLAHDLDPLSRKRSTAATRRRLAAGQRAESNKANLATFAAAAGATSARVDADDFPAIDVLAGDDGGRRAGIDGDARRDRGGDHDVGLAAGAELSYIFVSAGLGCSLVSYWWSEGELNSLRLLVLRPSLGNPPAP